MGYFITSSAAEDALVKIVEADRDMTMRYYAVNALVQTKRERTLSLVGEGLPKGIIGISQK